MKSMHLLAGIAMILAPITSTAARAADPFWAQATFVRGTVTSKPAGAPEGAKVALGAVLHKGDLVTAGEASSASFLLNDGSLLVVRAGNSVKLGEKGGEGGPTLAAVATNLSKTLLSREGNNPMLKHLGGLRGAGRNIVLAPNRTKVRSGSVRLLWLPHAGTKNFLVTVMGPGDSLFETKVSGTEFDLPAEKVAITGSYYWEVRDADSKDSMSSLGSGNFSTLDRQSIAEVSGMEAKISQAFPAASPGEDSTGLFLSYQIYREHGLALDALRTLEKMISLRPDDQELLRWRKEMTRDLGIDERDIASVLGS